MSSVQGNSDPYLAIGIKKEGGCFIMQKELKQEIINKFKLHEQIPVHRKCRLLF